MDSQRSPALIYAQIALQRFPFAMSSQFDQSHLIWTPAYPSHVVCERLRREINIKDNLNLSASIIHLHLKLEPYCQRCTVEDYHDLHVYSVSSYTFWLDLWQFLGIISSVPPDPTKVSCTHYVKDPAS